MLTQAYEACFAGGSVGSIVKYQVQTSKHTLRYV